MAQWSYSTVQQLFMKLKLKPSSNPAIILGIGAREMETSFQPKSDKFYKSL